MKIAFKLSTLLVFITVCGVSFAGFKAWYDEMAFQEWYVHSPLRTDEDFELFFRNGKRFDSYGDRIYRELHANLPTDAGRGSLPGGKKKALALLAADERLALRFCRECIKNKPFVREAFIFMDENYICYSDFSFDKETSILYLDAILERAESSEDPLVTVVALCVLRITLDRSIFNEWRVHLIETMKKRALTLKINEQHLDAFLRYCDDPISFNALGDTLGISNSEWRKFLRERYYPWLYRTTGKIGDYGVEVDGYVTTGSDVDWE